MNGVRVRFWLGPGTRLDLHLTVWLYLHAFFWQVYYFTFNIKKNTKLLQSPSDVDLTTDMSHFYA